MTPIYWHTVNDWPQLSESVGNLDCVGLAGKSILARTHQHFTQSYMWFHRWFYCSSKPPQWMKKTTHTSIRLPNSLHKTPAKSSSSSAEDYIHAAIRSSVCQFESMSAQTEHTSSPLAASRRLTSMHGSLNSFGFFFATNFIYTYIHSFSTLATRFNL